MSRIDAPPLPVRVVGHDIGEAEGVFHADVGHLEARAPQEGHSEDEAAEARELSISQLFVAMTRARDLVITSASPGKKAAGWLTQLEPLIGTDIPTIPYSILAEAAEPPQSSRGTQPTVDGLTMAIERLMPPPEQPLLQRMPATKLAKERENRPEQTSTQPAVKNATELGSLGHAVLEHLAHDEWQGSVVAWIERLREDFNLEKTEASTLQQRIEQTREVMTSLMSNMIDVRPEFPFVIHESLYRRKTQCCQRDCASDRCL